MINYKEESLRELLLKHPDSGQVVIGNGTVRVNPKRIINSENYKELCSKLKEHFKDNR
jgi:hypothetical protein